jgi:lambda family phage portal protein
MLMGFFDSIFGRRRDQRRPVMVRAKYDAAADSPENRRHWANADALSADASLSASVRKRLRERARYEAANNSYARGIILTLSNDVVGTGPRLQLRTEDAELNRRVEDAFDAWATHVRLADKLRCMRAARAESGECFAVLVQNSALPGEIKLDLRLVEADQVASPSGALVGDGTVDGIEFDRFGNPVAYQLLRAHPGSGSSLAMQADRVPAANVLHYYRSDRPGQSRGIPDITPALPLFAQLRRYTLAVITAAETAANIAGTIETDAPADGADQVEPLDLVELDRNSLLTMPAGWKMKQVQAEQPTTTYGDFKREIINEIARCLNMPFNVAACNSASYNYSSGRLDHQTYYRSVRIDQQHMADTVLDRVLRAWLDEAILVSGLIPPQMRMAAWPHEWFWPGQEHVDPAKEANAAQTRLETHTTTLAAEFARQGKDWEAELRQRSREIALMRELGLPLSQQQPQQQNAPAIAPDGANDESE